MNYNTPDKSNRDIGYVVPKVNAGLTPLIDWEKIARALFDMLDEIDTIDDLAKGDEKLYRNLVRKEHIKRFDYAATDGYVVRFKPTGG